MFQRRATLLVHWQTVYPEWQCVHDQCVRSIVLGIILHSIELCGPLCTDRSGHHRRQLRKHSLHCGHTNRWPIVDGKTFHISFGPNKILLEFQFQFQIADQKGDASLKAFKYNEDKTLKWLSLKCKKLSQELIGRNFNIGAKSEYFVKSSKLDDQSQNGTK